MANDGLFFRFFTKIHRKYRTPVVALIIPAIWAAGMVAIGTFQELFTATIFPAWIFYGLLVLGVIVLRKNEPEVKRPFRCPFYPIPPLLFVAAAICIVINTTVTDLTHAFSGLALILAGVPLYTLFLGSQRHLKGTSA